MESIVEKGETEMKTLTLLICAVVLSGVEGWAETKYTKLVEVDCRVSNAAATWSNEKADWECKELRRVDKGGKVIHASSFSGPTSGTIHIWPGSTGITDDAAAEIIKENRAKLVEYSKKLLRKKKRLLDEIARIDTALKKIDSGEMQVEDLPGSPGITTFTNAADFGVVGTTHLLKIN